MRIALFADIHANLEALEACLAHAARARAERLVFLGDLVGYGADPMPVIARVRGLMEDGALALRGNHEEAALFGPLGFSNMAAVAARWTTAQLDADARALLESLPLTLVEEDRLYTHADASAPERWRYVTDAASARTSLDATEARLTFCGHTHVPLLACLSATAKLVLHKPAPDVMLPLQQPRRWIAVIGAVGQPRDGSPAACYGLLDTARAECAWMRVPYDVAGAATKIRAAGLPAALAERLFTGT